MSDDRNRILSAYLELRGALRRFLTRRAGSIELADDLLQETYFRVAGLQGSEAVADPKAYVFRIAANLAVDQRRADSRRLLRTAEIDALFDFPDEAPGPASIAEGRSELEALSRALDELPARRREILLMNRVQHLPHREIAAHFGITTRTVENEILRALEHCGARLERIVHRRFGSRPPESS